MHSCLYEGRVTHRRLGPVGHHFAYPLLMAYLDLDELPRLLERGGVISGGAYAPASFMPGDHLFRRGEPLASEARTIVEAVTRVRPRGPVRLLTQLRSFGYYFSPLNLFYLFDETGQRVEHVVAEVNNTPWGERHCYVLWDGNRAGHGLRFSHPKGFHVSPFMGMDMTYEWRLSAPGDCLRVSLANFRESERVFDAQLALRRQELSKRRLRAAHARRPWPTARIVTAIYYQALKLWWKRCPFFTHPKNLADTATPSTDQPLTGRHQSDRSTRQDVGHAAFSGRS